MHGETCRSDLQMALQGRGLVEWLTRFLLSQKLIIRDNERTHLIIPVLLGTIRKT